MESKDTRPSSSVSLLKDDKLAEKIVQSDNIITDNQVPEKKQKKRRLSEHPKQQGDTSQKKGKKRKNGYAEQDESKGHGVQSLGTEAESESPKKKHKNRTSFADPREDTQLNTQSRKALEYVFTQMNRPSRWKFNKARQNWLIRNVWSSETVPDIYFPLVLKYLANVQGGSREKLRETCQTYLTVKAIPVEAPPSMPSTESEIKPTKPIPGPLVTPSSRPTPGVITSVSMHVSDAATIVASINCTRAQSLFDVLT